MTRIFMCPPRHFSIQYEINPWMKVANGIDPALAEEQWKGLYAVFKRLKVSLLTITPRKGLPDMVFTANAGIVHNKTFIPSHFRFKQRQGETAIFTRYFKSKGYR